MHPPMVQLQLNGQYSIYAVAFSLRIASLSSGADADLIRVKLFYSINIVQASCMCICE